MAESPIDQIIAGTTIAAKESLRSMLAELESVWCNFDAVCQQPHECRKALSIDHLKALRRAINRALEANCKQPDEATGTRPASSSGRRGDE